MFLLLPLAFGSIVSRVGAGKREGGESREREGGSGGVASGQGCITKVHWGDHGWNWMTQIALSIQRAFPVHPGVPLLQGMEDRETNLGRRGGGRGGRGMLAKN